MESIVDDNAFCDDASSIDDAAHTA
jgi:hypothetical protein